MLFFFRKYDRLIKWKVEVNKIEKNECFSDEYFFALYCFSLVLDGNKC